MCGIKAKICSKNWHHLNASANFSEIKSVLLCFYKSISQTKLMNNLEDSKHKNSKVKNSLFACLLKPCEASSESDFIWQTLFRAA